MVIKVEYFDGIEKEFNSFDDIIDYNNIKILDCSYNNLTELRFACGSCSQGKQEAHQNYQIL
jgi:hypothetical protein